jgi:hypothetical protein
MTLQGYGQGESVNAGQCFQTLLKYYRVVLSDHEKCNHLSLHLKAIYNARNRQCNMKKGFGFFGYEVL